jgi:hypothetical protein
MTCPNSQYNKIKIGNDQHQYLSVFYKEKLEKPMGVVGLNPSLLKNGKNATITILMDIAEREGFDSLFVANLYSYISPDPKKLKGRNDDNSKNDIWIENVSKECKKILCIWGNHADQSRIEAVFPKIADKAYAIGLTKSGRPRHVLHTKKNAKLIKL